MGFICNALLSFSLFFINKCFSPTSRTSRNRKKYRQLVKLTKRISKFMVKLDRKWSAIVVSDVDFSNPEEFFLNKLDVKLPSSTSFDASSKETIEDFGLTDQDSQHLQQEIDEDLSKIDEEMKGDAFIL